MGMAERQRHAKQASMWVAAQDLPRGAARRSGGDLLGHANITTTSRYLRSTSTRLARALDRLGSESRPKKVETNGATGAYGRFAHESHTRRLQTTTASLGGWP
jgi:hypothetical protein